MKKLLIYIYCVGFLPLLGCPTCAHPMYENEEYIPLFFTNEYYETGKKYYQVDAPEKQLEKKDANETNSDTSPSTDSQ